MWAQPYEVEQVITLETHLVPADRPHWFLLTKTQRTGTKYSFSIIQLCLAVENWESKVSRSCCAAYQVENTILEGMNLLLWIPGHVLFLWKRSWYNLM